MRILATTAIVAIAILSSGCKSDANGANGTTTLTSGGDPSVPNQASTDNSQNVADPNQQQQAPTDPNDQVQQQPPLYTSPQNVAPTATTQSPQAQGGAAPQTNVYVYLPRHVPPAMTAPANGAVQEPVQQAQPQNGGPSYVPPVVPNPNVQNGSSGYAPNALYPSGTQQTLPAPQATNAAQGSAPPPRSAPLNGAQQSGSSTTAPPR